MLKLVKHIWERRLIYYIAFFMVACPVSAVFGILSPENLRFLEPVVCPPGMHLDQTTESRPDLEGNMVELRAMCTDGEERVERTGWLALFVCGAPVLVGILLVLPAFFTPSKKQEDPVELGE